MAYIPIEVRIRAAMVQIILKSNSIWNFRLHLDRDLATFMQRMDSHNQADVPEQKLPDVHWASHSVSGIFHSRRAWVHPLATSGSSSFYSKEKLPQEHILVTWLAFSVPFHIQTLMIAANIQCYGYSCTPSIRICLFYPGQEEEEKNLHVTFFMPLKWRIRHYFWILSRMTSSCLLWF